MDTIKSLIIALQTAAKTAQVEMIHAPRDGRVGWAHISEQTTRPVADALRAVPAIAALEPYMYLLPNQSSVIDLNSIAIYLTFRAQAVDADALVHDLLRLVTERQISVTEVRLVSDIEPVDKIDLCDGFSVVPASGVPVTEHSTWIFSERNQPAHGWGRPPSAALTCSRTIPLTLLPRPKAGEMDFPMHDQLAPHTDWDAAMNALIVGSDGAPQFRQHFLVVNDIGWLGMPNTSLGGSESFPVPGKPASYIHTERLPHLFSALRKQNSTITLAIKQLESSRRRLSEVERAIDLGICVEVLLMSGAKDNGEISYKIATRAAWLLGETPEKREEVYETARMLYSMRSSAAHTGALKATRNMEESEAQIAQLKKCDDLCVSLIAELAERGIPKDWKLVVLGLPAD